MDAEPQTLTEDEAAKADGPKTLGASLTEAAGKAERTEHAAQSSGHDAAHQRRYPQRLRRRAWRAFKRVELNEWLTLGVTVATLAVAIVALETAVDSKQMANAIGRLTDIVSAQQDEVNGIANETSALDNEADATTNVAEQTAALVGPAQTTASSAVAANRIQQNNFILDQQPNIVDAQGQGIPKPAEPGFVTDGEHAGWNYSTRNVGKSAAYSIRTYEYVSIHGGEFKSVPHPRTQAELSPGVTNWSTASYPEPLSLFDRQGKPTDLTLVVGIVSDYIDREKNPYHTEICFFLHDNGSVGACHISEMARIFHVPVPTGAR